MATTTSGVEFEELEDSPKISYRQGGITARRELRVAWDDVARFTADLLGGYRLVAGQAVSNMPAFFPGGQVANLYCAELDIEPFHGAVDGSRVTTLESGVNKYSAGAKVIASYRQKQLSTPGGNSDEQYPAPGGTFFTYSRDGWTSFLTIPSRGYKWVSDGKQLPDDLHSGLVIGTVVHQLTWHNVIRIPSAAISACRGKVNNGRFLGCNTETLLFVSDRLQQDYRFNTARQPTSTITYTFHERAISNGAIPVTWNETWNPLANDWDGVRDMDDNDLYRSADFTTLLSLA